MEIIFVLIIIVLLGIIISRKNEFTIKDDESYSFFLDDYSSYDNFIRKQFLDSWDDCDFYDPSSSCYYIWDHYYDE